MERVRSYGACMRIWLFVLVAGMALGADKRLLPGQAGNDNIELTGTLMIDPAEIRQAVGSELGAGIIVARVKASNKTGEPMRIGPDDFVLISRKDAKKLRQQRKTH